MNYLSDNREKLKTQYPTFEDFKKKYSISNKMYNDLVEYAKKEGVVDSAKLYFAANLEKFAKEKKAELDSIYASENDLRKMDILDKMISDYMKEAYKKSVEERNSDKAPNLIKTYMLFEIARNIYSYSDAYQ